MRRAAAAGLLAALAPLLAGCGGDDGQDARAAYVADANTVCRRASATLAALTPPADLAGTPAYLEQAFGVSADAVAELVALEPPAQDAGALRERFLAPLEATTAALQALLPQLRADPQAALAAYVDPPGADRAFLQEYGLTDCLDFGGVPG